MNKNRSFLHRLGFALEGLKQSWLRERSVRAQVTIGLLATAMLILLRPGWLWAATVVLAIGLVIAIELVNTALEHMIDHIHPDIHPHIKLAKDAAAAASLVTSLSALCVGVMMALSMVWP
jgi:undecaprenol kinase